jgi:hypothetical protein
LRTITRLTLTNEGFGVLSEYSSTCTTNSCPTYVTAIL